VLEKFQAQERFDRATELMDGAWMEAIAGMSREEIAGRFLALTFPEVFEERAPEAAQQQARPAAPAREERSERAHDSRPARKIERPVAAHPSRKFSVERPKADQQQQQENHHEKKKMPWRKERRDFSAPPSRAGDERPHRFNRKQK